MSTDSKGVFKRSPLQMDGLKSKPAHMDSHTLPESTPDLKIFANGLEIQHSDYPKQIVRYYFLWRP